MKISVSRLNVSSLVKRTGPVYTYIHTLLGLLGLLGRGLFKGGYQTEDAAAGAMVIDLLHTAASRLYTTIDYPVVEGTRFFLFDYVQNSSQTGKCEKSKILFTILTRHAASLINDTVFIYIIL